MGGGSGGGGVEFPHYVESQHREWMHRGSGSSEAGTDAKVQLTTPKFSVSEYLSNTGFGFFLEPLDPTNNPYGGGVGSAQYDPVEYTAPTTQLAAVQTRWDTLNSDLTNLEHLGD